MAADKKIPLLTDVYQPKPSAEPQIKPFARTKQEDAILITPELIARVTGHVRPRLEAEITQSVLSSVREALRRDLLQDLQADIINAQLAIEANTINFVDKTKADLKTELPQMYQGSADLVLKGLAEHISTLQNDAVSKLDASLAQLSETEVQAASQVLHAQIADLQAGAKTQLMQDVNQEMQAFKVETLGSQQAILRQEMSATFAAMNQDAKTGLQQQLSSLQADALTQMRTTFTEAMPSIYTNAIAEQQEQMMAQISQSLHQELQAFQASAVTEHQAQLTQSIGSHQNQLAQSLASNFDVINSNAKEDLAERLRAIQADAVEQMRSTLHASIPSIYAAAGDDVKEKFADEMTAQGEQLHTNFLATINADLPAVQEVMRDNIQQILATMLPNLELDMRKQLTSELEDLLLKVKFVLPK